MNEPNGFNKGLTDSIRTLVKNNPGIKLAQLQKELGEDAARSNIGSILNSLYKRGELYREVSSAPENFGRKVFQYWSWKERPTHKTTEHAVRLSNVVNEDILVTVRYGDKKSITLSYDELTELHDKISKLFGG